MKTTLSFGLIVAAASTLLACSDDEGAVRGEAGSSGQTGNAGSAGTGAGGSAGTGAGGSAGTGAGGSAGTGPTANLGPALVISATGDVVDETGTSGIDGNAFLAQSSVMLQPAVAAHQDGKLCMSGATAAVPDANSYGTHWGAELGLNLKTMPDPDAAPVADAGADAGAPLEVPAPWPYGTAIGFSFKLEGTQLPGNLRFKGLPVGSDPAADTFCNQVTGGAAPALVAGATQEVLFSEITFECWAMGNSNLAEDEIQQAGTPPTVRENPKALQNISWQVPGELVLEFPFDFCITDIRPILP